VLHIRRVKNGTPSTHPIQGDELRALRRLHRESPSSPFVFVSERGSPFTTVGFARIIERAADVAGLELKAHPHMLRHACGYALANKGHDTRAIHRYVRLCRLICFAGLCGCGSDVLSKGFLAGVAEQFRDGLLWSYGLHGVSCAMHVDQGRAALLLNDLHPQVSTIGNSELRQRIFSWQRFLLDRGRASAGRRVPVAIPSRKYRLVYSAGRRCLQRGSDDRSYEAEFSGVALASTGSIAARRVSFLVIAS
jgi:Phage integrase family